MALKGDCPACMTCWVQSPTPHKMYDGAGLEFRDWGGGNRRSESQGDPLVNAKFEASLIYTRLSQRSKIFLLLEAFLPICVHSVSSFSLVATYLGPTGPSYFSCRVPCCVLVCWCNNRELAFLFSMIMYIFLSLRWLALFFCELPFNFLGQYFCFKSLLLTCSSLYTKWRECLAVITHGFFPPFVPHHLTFVYSHFWNVKVSHFFHMK